MSLANPCDCACPTPTITEIPGAPGAAGAAGANGTNGVNAYTTLTANVVLPATASPVVLPTAVVNSSWAAIGQIIFISDGTNKGHFRVLTKPSVSGMTLYWLKYAGDSAGASVIAFGTSLVSPAGVQPPLSAALPAAVDYSALTAAGAVDNLAVASGVGISTLIIPLTSLATGLSTLAIDLLTSFVPGYKFKILSFDFVTTVVGAGAGASQVFNLEIGSTNLTGGVLTVTLASTNTIGAITSGTAITANNAGSAANNVSIEMSAGGTVFSGGAGYFVIKIQNMDTADAVAALSDHVNDLITSLTP